MNKMKKEINKERMYEKIMPSNLKNIQPTAGFTLSNEIAPGTVPIAISPANLTELHIKLSVETPTNMDNQAVKPVIEEKSADKAQPQTIIEEGEPLKAIHGNLVIANVMEDLVVQKLDEVMKRFNCCMCRRCRMDVTAIALNKLTPKYVAYDREQIRALLERENSAEVITALVHAVIAVKAKPGHDI